MDLTTKMSQNGRKNYLNTHKYKIFHPQKQLLPPQNVTFMYLCSVIRDKALGNAWNHLLLIQYIY